MKFLEVVQSVLMKELRCFLPDVLWSFMYLWMCQAWGRTPNPFSQSHHGLRTWHCTLGLLYWSSLSYWEEKRIFLPIHQMISSDIFEICKMLSKRTFIFKLYSPKCVYEIIFLRSYSMLCRIAFCSVIYYYSSRNSMACIFYFKLNFSSNCALRV